MKLLTVIIPILFSLNSLASNEIKTEQAAPVLSSPYSMEPSFSISSLNNGSQFLSVGLTARLWSWFHLGMEGDVPANYENKAQMYMVRGFGRISLLSGTDHVFVQAGLSQGFFSQEGLYDDVKFAAIDALIGYSRKISTNWSLGGRVGVQYVSGFTSFQRIDGYYLNAGEKLYNRLSLAGTYSF